MLTAFAAGDLTTRMEGEFGGVLGELQGDANVTAAKLAMTVKDIQNASDDIRTSIATIAGGAQQLSARTKRSPRSTIARRTTR